ncbi:MAG: hypothetical protein V7645_2578 [Actinomycetota bacterium]|jgi:uncharacterized protein YndB with AHSA1/START domain
MTMTSSGAATVTLPSDREILITREFDAPKHLVYKAWTTPELVRRWWHAKRGEVTIAEIDLRVGGRWRYVSVTPDGFEAGFHGEYREIVPNDRLVSTEVYEGIPDAEEHAVLAHPHPHRGGRADDPHGPRGAPDEGRPRRPHQLRHGGRHAGRHGSPGAGRDLASLSTIPHSRPPGGRSRWSGVTYGSSGHPSVTSSVEATITDVATTEG